ncbi:MAG: nitric oxide reductase transcriptional regulator NorR [Idiomarina sp.]|nr:nitric oxide reductase transcriptional regulator NorR [Idiomarina sp.]
MLEQTLIADLTTEVNTGLRLQHAVSCLRTQFACTAVVLLKLDGDYLVPVASHGLVTEANGRRFKIAEHPRLAMLLKARQPHLFPPDSDLPDPYDGLLDEHTTGSLAVHDCLGMALYIDGQCWGVVTLDAQAAGTFNEPCLRDLQRYSFLLEAILRTNRLEREVRALRTVSRETYSGPAPAQGHADIIGRSEKLSSLLAEIDVVARSDLPVLLQGETGTGKELIARRLHQNSNRSARPMIYINCAALPESLVESELFGHVKGAFSGATSARGGRFEAAHQGTLFLDEVGELPLSIQAKLLRVLQSGDIQRVGADHTKQVDVRVIAATNRNLKSLVKDELFRADLYHRLSVYPVVVPPLRERDTDVLHLAGYFLEQNRARLGFRNLRLDSEAEAVLLNYSWPGNVRELEHVISRVAVKALSLQQQCGGIVTITRDMLNDIASETDDVRPRTVTTSQHSPVSLRQAVTEAQRAAISAALQRNEQRWAPSARELEVDPSNLHKLARKLGLKGVS